MQTFCRLSLMQEQKLSGYSRVGMTLSHSKSLWRQLPPVMQMTELKLAACEEYFRNLNHKQLY